MEKNKKRWYNMTVEEIEEALKTNHHTGLSDQDIASAKSINNGRKSLYTFPELSAKDAVKLVLNDVAVYYIAFIAVLCAVFQRAWFEAIVAIVIIAANCTLTAFLKIVSNKYENAVMAPSVPRCDVLRNGRIVSIDGRNVVEGDIMFMKAGDILPCDVRIIDSKGLSVFEIVEIDAKGNAKYATSHKRPDTISEDIRVPIGKVHNMVFVNSVVNAGYGRGIVVACGSKTAFGSTGNGIEMRSDNSVSETDNVINKVFKYITVALFAMIVPFIFINLLSGNSGVSPIDSLTQVGALAGSLPMQTVAIVYSTVICCLVRLCSTKTVRAEKKSSVIKKYASVDKINRTEKLFLFGKTAVSAKGSCIESIYSDMTETDKPVYSDKPSDLINSIEHAFLINNAAKKLSGKNLVPDDRNTVYKKELLEYGVSPDSLLSSYEFLSYKRLLSEEASDVVVISTGNDFNKHYSLICRSLDRRIIDCADWYSSSGVDAVLDDRLREEIRETYNKYKRLGYEVVTIARAIAKLYDKDSFDEYEGQLVFEGMIAVGNVYSRENAESVKTLLSLGVSPVVCLGEESEVNRYIVRNLFRNVTDAPDIIYASILAEKGENILDYPNADAYFGFSDNNLAELIVKHKTEGRTVASVVTDFSDLRAAGKSDCIIAYSFDQLKENACTEPYPDMLANGDTSCSAAKKYADILVYPVTRTGGGIDGILNTIKRIRPFLSNLNKAVSYMLFSLAARMTAVYLPLLSGRQAMNASMTLYLGCIVDLVAVLAIAFNPESDFPNPTYRNMFTSVKSVLTYNLKRIIGACICGAVIFACGMMIPKTAVLEMQSYTFIALILLQLVNLVLSLLEPIKNITRRKALFTFIAVSAVLAVTLIFGVIPGINTAVGLDGGVTSYLRALLITVITGPFAFVIQKISNKA